MRRAARNSALRLTEEKGSIVNRKSLFLASCLGLAAVFAMFAPGTAAAIGNCYCYTGNQTGQNWGMGSSCTAANSDLRAHLLAEANDWCTPDPVCSFAVQYTTTCWQPTPTTWQADGFATFGCRICEEGPFIP